MSAEAIDDLEHAADPERALRLWRAQFSANPFVWFHEHYHYWQGLRLPFLLWYASFSLRAVFTVFDEGLKTGLPFENWTGTAPELSYLSDKMRCNYEGDDAFSIGSENAPASPETVLTALLSPLDLIEGMTSIADWQAQAIKTDLENVRSFQRWAKRNPAYLGAFRFVGGVLQDEALALRIFCALVEAAFHTSHPLKGMLLLLRIFQQFRLTPLGRTIIAQQEPCRWPELFLSFLDMIRYEAPSDSMRGILVDHPFCRLDRANWVGASWDGSDFLHPFLSPNARKWLTQEKTEPAYSWLLAQPGWVPKEIFWDAFDTYYPPVTILHFALNNGKNRIIIGGHPETTASDFLKSGNFLTLLTAFSVVRRATGTHYTPDIRLCHHTDCPHYPANYCNLYPVIPESWQKCGFPSRVEQISTFLRTSPRSTP